MTRGGSGRGKRTRQVYRRAVPSSCRFRCAAARSRLCCARYPMRRSLHRLAATLGVVLALLGPAPSAARQNVTPTNVTAIRAAEFFTPAKVWTAHLSMSAAAWLAMQPRNGPGGGGVGFGRFLGPPGGRNGVAARQGIEFDYVHA